jgi:hypothetical protein
MDGHIQFLHATAMAPILQNGRTNQNITTSMPHMPKWMDVYHSCTRTPWHPFVQIGGFVSTSLAPCHPYAKMDRPFGKSQPQLHSIRQNGWTYNILGRDHHATHTPKWTAKSEHHYLHATPYAKIDRIISFLYNFCTWQPCRPYA